MAPGEADKKVEKSYLSSAVESINPWAGKRSSSPAPPPAPPHTLATKPQDASQIAPSVATVDPGDHSITHLYGQSFRNYPPDCPPLNVQWFHAIDLAKRKPQLVRGGKKAGNDTKQPGSPKKFSAFSTSDSKAIEKSYQKLLELTEDQGSQLTASAPLEPEKSAFERRVEGARESTEFKNDVHVAVNEDFLFDVNIEQRELAPVYWLGPVYEVRRGTWFYQEGSNLRPCEENLAAQLEEGYLKMKPWLNPVRPRSHSAANRAEPKPSNENLKSEAESQASAVLQTTQKPQGPTTTSQGTPAPPQSYRLFGTYMNSIATYQDATTAWLSSDTMLSWVTSSVYERFAGGGYMSGIKLTRGYSEPSKGKDKDDKDRDKDKEKEKTDVSSGVDQGLGLDERQQRLLKRRSAPPTTTRPDEGSSHGESTSNEVESREMRLQRQLSSLMEGDTQTVAETEEQAQKRQEQEIQEYHTQAGETQGREVDHLILVTHGIGQQLGLRMDSVNFVQDVNVLRKTLKSVYASSADLKALNSEFGTGNGNCRVQVLPVCWRHLLEFPKQREKRREHDLGDITEEDDNYPSLEDITVEGVAFARSLISDLALDVLLYQSSYRKQISKIVLNECNRILALYKERNPEFKGKVHVMGHSLGSAILFDILCRQQSPTHPDNSRNSLRFWASQGRPGPIGSKTKDHDMAFDFEVEDFYCLGSPIGLFQMLEGRTIAARPPNHSEVSEATAETDLPEDPFLSAPMGASVDGISQSHLPSSISSPKARQLFNIFHPSDPISYRLEPLISPAMTALKPQGLPYTKKGLLNAANQGLTGFGAKVGQSVSGLWSSLSAGIASNMLNRSLGLTNEEVARMADQAQSNHQQKRQAEAKDQVSSSGFIADGADVGEKTDERKKQLADFTATGGNSNNSGNDPTLIDDELETLFSQFQKRRTETSKESERLGKSQDEQRKVRKMRTEESKVRALNRNGRVDYSIQESVLDFNPMNTIASHMAYWADVDVNHFILSQLLANRSKTEGVARKSTK